LQIGSSSGATHNDSTTFYTGGGLTHKFEPSEIRVYGDASQINFSSATGPHKIITGAGADIQVTPGSDSTTFFQVTNAAATSFPLNIDTSNIRVGINKVDPEVSMHFVTTASALYPFYLENVSANPLPGMTGRSAKGTPGSETATQSGNILAAFAGRGHTGSAFESGSPVSVVMFASENHSATNQGAEMSFRVTPNGSTFASSVQAMKIQDDSRVSIGTKTNPNFQLEVNSSDPVIALHNLDHENGDDGQHGLLLWRGEDANGVEATIVNIRGSHDGAVADNAGRVTISTRETAADGGSLLEALRIDSVRKLTYTGDSLFQPHTNSTTAYQWGNAAGSAFPLTLDASNIRAGVNMVAPVDKLHLGTASGGGARFQAVTGNSGDTVHILFKTSSDVTANYWKTGIIAEDSGQSGARGNLYLGTDTSNDSGSFGVADAQIKIDYTGVTHIGGVNAGTNEAQFAADGELNLAGTARVTKKITLKATAARIPGGAPPGQTNVGNYAVLQYAGIGVIVEQAFFTTGIPNGWAVGTDWTVHVHWAPVNANAGDVKWQIDWVSLASENNEVLTAGVTSTSVVDSTQTLQDELLKSGEMTISGASLAAEDIVSIRLYRDPADGADTYGFDASFVEMDIEFILDKLGTAT
jgi:hypothetical protein